MDDGTRLLILPNRPTLLTRITWLYMLTVYIYMHGPLMSSKIFGQKFAKLWAISWWLATRANSTLCWTGLELTLTSTYNIIITCSALWILYEETNYFNGKTHALKRFLVSQLGKNVPRSFNTILTCNKQRLSTPSWISYSQSISVYSCLRSSLVLSFYYL